MSAPSGWTRLGRWRVLSAGLVHGTYGRRVGMSETTRRLLGDLWEFLGFLANALVFLLVGFTANLGSLIAAAWPVVVSVVAVLLARAVVLRVREWSLPRNSW